MNRFLKFLNSGAGLLILGFLVTTGGGAILNLVIQSRALNNEQYFEIFQIRLNEAKTFQTDLLKQMSARSVGLAGILLEATRKTKDREQHLMETEKLWRANYSGVKDEWNRNLINLHSKMSVLYPSKLANLITLR